MAASGPLSSAEALLRRIVADLHALGRRCALIGGLAVSAGALAAARQELGA